MLFERAGLMGRMPRIVASGSRSDAYSDFCTAIKNVGPNDYVLLLDDSEAPVTVAPWQHVALRDG